MPLTEDPSPVAESLPARLFRRIRSQYDAARTGTLAKSSFFTFVLLIFYTGVGFVTTFVLARTMGAAHYGYYSFALATASLLSVPAMLGMGHLLMREVSVFNRNGDWAHLNGIVLRSFLMVVGTSSIAASGAFVWFKLLNGEADAGMGVAFVVGLILVPLMCMTRLGEAVLRGFEKPVSAALAQNLVQPVLFLAFILAALLFSNKALLGPDAVRLNAVASGLALVFLGYLLARNWPREARSRTPAYATKAWLLAGIPFAVHASLEAINQQTPVIALGLFADAAETGVYRVTSRLAQFITFAVVAINLPMAPRFAAFGKSGEMQEIEILATKASLFAFAVALPQALVLVVFGQRILDFFGSEFSMGATALSIAAVSMVINAVLGPLETILMMTNRARLAAIGVFLNATLIVSLCFWLIPLYGINGAALSAGISAVCYKLLLSVLVWRTLGIRPSLIGLVWRTSGPRSGAGPRK